MNQMPKYIVEIEGSITDGMADLEMKMRNAIETMLIEETKRKIRLDQLSVIEAKTIPEIPPGPSRVNELYI